MGDVGDAIRGDEPLLDVWRKAAQGDGLLPSEKALSSLLGVGRNSVREALIRMEANGMVARRHGAGTFINPAALEVQIRFDRTDEYSCVLRDAGLEPGVEVLSAGWVDLDELAALKLREPEGSLAFRTEKCWSADGLPVMHAEDLIPSRRRLDVDPSASVFELALLLNGHGTDWVCSWVDAVPAGALAGVLDCAQGQPVLSLEQVGVSRSGQRSWLARETHNPSRYPGGIRYGLVRTVTGSP